MTLLEDLQAKGLVVQINDFIEEGRPIHIPASAQVFTDFVEHSGRDVLIFHTKDYNYIAYPWSEAHERNMEIIYNDIERWAKAAESRINQMATERGTTSLVLYGPLYARTPVTLPDGSISVEFSTEPFEGLV